MIEYCMTEYGMAYFSTKAHTVNPPMYTSIFLCNIEGVDFSCGFLMGIKSEGLHIYGGINSGLKVDTYNRTMIIDGVDIV